MVYPIGKKIIPPIYKLWLRNAKGIENIPEAPFIIAANHSSYYDTVLPHSIIIPILNKKIHALSNSTYWKNPITRWILNLSECIPVYVKKEKYHQKKNKLAFEKAVSYLKKNEIVMIFPEGKRSSDGKLQKAYGGVGRLVLKSKVPVLPFGIIDSHKVFPKGKILPRFARCEVKIGKLIYFNEYYGKRTSKKTLEEITRNIMKEIAKLIGQEYSY